MSDYGSSTDYGFTWGPIEVQRSVHIPGRGWSLGVLVNGDRVLEIFVSEKGRVVRVYRDGKEIW